LIAPFTKAFKNKIFKELSSEINVDFIMMDNKKKNGMNIKKNPLG